MEQKHPLNAERLMRRAKYFVSHKDNFGEFLRLIVSRIQLKWGRRMTQSEFLTLVRVLRFHIACSVRYLQRIENKDKIGF